MSSFPWESSGGSRSLGQSQVWVRTGGRGGIREEVKARFYKGLGILARRALRIWKRSAVGGRAFSKATQYYIEMSILIGQSMQGICFGVVVEVSGIKCVG